MPEEIINITIEDSNEAVNITVEETTEEINITIGENQPIKTSDLINDGENGVDPFITLQDLPPSGAVESVTGTLVDNTDPLNPVVDSQFTSDEVNAIQDANVPSATNVFATINDLPSAITIDANPTNGSNNAVSSNGVFDALANKVDTITGYSLTKNDFTDTLKTKLDGIAAGAEVNVNADWNAVSGDAQILNKPTIPSITGLVPYTGANANVDLGANTLTAQSILASGTAGNGHIHLRNQSSTPNGLANYMTIFSNSSGNSLGMVNTGGNAVTLDLSLLSTNRNYTFPNSAGTIALTTDITKSAVGLSNVDNTSDINKPVSTAQATAIALKEDSANKQTDLTASSTKYPTVNAVNTGLGLKENTITAGTTGQYYRGDKTFQTLDKTAVGLANVDNTSDANKPVSTAQLTALNLKQRKLFNLTPQVTHTGTTVKTIIATYYIPANTFTAGDFLNFSALVTKVANINLTTHTLEINTSNTLTGATVISTAGLNTINFSMKFKREMVLNGGNIYLLNISAATPNDQTIGNVPNGISTFTYNLGVDLYFFVTCQLTSASDSITYRGIQITD